MTSLCAHRSAAFLCTSLAVVLLGGCSAPERTVDSAYESAKVDEESYLDESYGDADLEELCEAERQAHIAHCGHRPPEEDYTCRTEEADKVYEACIKGLSYSHGTEGIEIHE